MNLGNRRGRYEAAKYDDGQPLDDGIAASESRQKLRHSWSISMAASRYINLSREKGFFRRGLVVRMPRRM